MQYSNMVTKNGLHVLESTASSLFVTEKWQRSSTIMDVRFSVKNWPHFVQLHSALNCAIKYVFGSWLHFGDFFLKNLAFDEFKERFMNVFWGQLSSSFF